MDFPTPEEILDGYRSWMETDNLAVANWPRDDQQTNNRLQNMIYDRLVDIRRDEPVIQTAMPPYIFCDVFLLTKPVLKLTQENELFIVLADQLEGFRLS